MTAKQWLSRSRRVDEEINALLRSYDEMKARLTSVTQRLTGETVQSTKDPHKFDKLAELSELIDERVDELVDIKRKTTDVISRVPDQRQREVLQRRYVANEAWEEIAVDMHYSYMQVHRFHGYGLNEVERILRDEGIL